MDRITIKDLETLVNRLNYEKAGFAGVTHKTIGSYHIGQAYGGYRLEKITNDSGGITVISSGGYETKRALYRFLLGMLAV